MREEELRGERRRRLNSCAPSLADVGRPSVRRATCLEWIASWGYSAGLRISLVLRRRKGKPNLRVHARPFGDDACLPLPYVQVQYKARKIGVTRNVLPKVLLILIETS